MNLSAINPYWPLIKLGLFVALCLGCYVYGGSNAKAKAQLACMKAQAKAVDAANARADAINKTLQDELAKPKSGPVIREVIRANPNSCVLAKPVADSVRDAIRRANEAAR